MSGRRYTEDEVRRIEAELRPKRDPVLADMAIRVARAEMERDAALEREKNARDDARRAWEMADAIRGGDKEKLLKTLHIIGIPAQDLADIYEIEQTWRREGGTDNLLEWWRKQRRPEGVEW